MFRINDYIMYGTTGVCKVVDIKEEKFINSTRKEYYVLRPIYSKNTIIKIPTDNNKISMRKVISKDEVSSLIYNMPNNDTIWIDDDRERTEKFKSMLRSGSCKELITLVKSIYSKRKLNHKSSYKSDNEIMILAEKLVNEEFSVILKISPEEVKSYILSHIPQ